MSKQTKSVEYISFTSGPIMLLINSKVKRNNLVEASDYLLNPEAVDRLYLI